MKNKNPIDLLLILFNFLLFFSLWGNWQINRILIEKASQPILMSSDRVLSQVHQTSEASKDQYQIPKLSLKEIFATNSAEENNFPEEKTQTLVVTGDVMLSRAVNAYSVRARDFVWPFEKTADFLQEADITLVNLETALLPDCPLTSEGMKLCGDPREVEGLVFSGVDVVNLANNHTDDFGQEGLKETEQFLEEARISAFGFSGPVYKEAKETTFAFLGYCEVCPDGQYLLGSEGERLVLEIEQARELAEIIVVSFHWGKEYSSQPANSQKNLAHLAIDAGADLVIGHHPHWIQPVEIYKEKLIVYSLGNFVFDQIWSEKTKEGLVGRFSFINNHLVEVEFLPIVMKNLGQPEFVLGEEKERILNELKQLSFQLAGI